MNWPSVLVLKFKIGKILKAGLNIRRFQGLYELTVDKNQADY